MERRGTNSLPASGLSFSLSDNRKTLTLTLPDEENLVLNRVPSVYGNIQGVWLQNRPENVPDNTEDEAVLFVFTRDNYIGFQPFAERDEDIGIEFGSYTFDPANNDLQLSVSVDTSGDSLTSDLTIVSAEVDKNQLTIEYQQTGDTTETWEATFSRR